MTREELYALSEGAETALSEQFREIDRISFLGTKKVMDAFAEDFLETQWFKSTIYEYTDEQRKEIQQLLNE